MQILGFELKKENYKFINDFVCMLSNKDEKTGYYYSRVTSGNNQITGYDDLLTWLAENSFTG